MSANGFATEFPFVLRRLPHLKLVHRGEDVGSLRFESVPAIEVGHGRPVGKARRESVQLRRIQNKALKFHVVRRDEGLDLGQRDPMLLHVKQEIATFVGREKILPLRQRFQQRVVGAMMSSRQRRMSSGIGR